MTGGLASSEEKDVNALLHDVSETGNALVDIFEQNRLYLSARIIQGFEAIRQAFNEAWVTFAFDRRDESLPVPRSERERRVAAWQKARELIRVEVPRLREQIENQMRDLLGDVADMDEDGTRAINRNDTVADGPSVIPLSTTPVEP